MFAAMVAGGLKSVATGVDASAGSSIIACCGVVSTESIRRYPGSGPDEEGFAMEQVMKQRDARQEKISRHAFFDWLRSERVPVQDRLAFVPASILRRGIPVVTTFASLTGR